MRIKCAIAGGGRIALSPPPSFLPPPPSFLRRQESFIDSATPQEIPAYAGMTGREEMAAGEGMAAGAGMAAETDGVLISRAEG
ncbi:MAG: hypothetical protein ACR2P5_02945 [Gammaproteobacteria bacterium]